MRLSPLQSWHEARGAVFAGPRVLRYAGAADEWRYVTEAAALFDASYRDRLLVTGEDRVSFIQGLCTNDVEKLPVGGSQETAFITPRGKLVADARVTKLEDALLFDLEPGRGAALAEQLALYRIHEETDWVDASEDLVALELWGPKAADVLGESSLPEGAGRAVEVGGAAMLAVGTAFGVALYVPEPAAEFVADELLSRLEAVGGGPAGEEAVEASRIERGLGRYGADWTESTNPLEAGLDRALDYKKGCYVGQEVVAKATYIGRVSRRLVRLSWQGEPAAPDAELLGGKTPGRITSSARIPGTDRVVALGYVRRDAAEAGTRLKVGADSGPEAVVDGYPYLSKEKPVD